MTADDWRRKRRERQEVGRERLAVAAAVGMPDGFQAISKFHWQGMVAGHKLDFFPSAFKWRFREKVYRGTRTDLDGFIRKRVECQTVTG